MGTNGTMRKITVYVAGPYSKPDPCINTRDAIMAGEELLNRGFAPFVPHLTHFWHTMFPHNYETWLDLDRQWLKLSDAVLRLPGESKGADKEIADAKEWGIPVFYSINELIDWRQTRRMRVGVVVQAAGDAGELTASEANAVAEAYGPVAREAVPNRCDCPDCTSARASVRIDEYQTRIKALSAEVADLRKKYQGATLGEFNRGYEEGVKFATNQRQAQAGAIADLSRELAQAHKERDDFIAQAESYRRATIELQQRLLDMDPNSSGLNPNLFGAVAANSIGKVGVIVGAKKYPAGWSYIGVNVDDGREWTTRTPAVVNENLGDFIVRREQVAHLKGKEGRAL